MTYCNYCDTTVKQFPRHTRTNKHKLNVERLEYINNLNFDTLYNGLMDISMWW